MVVIIAVVIVAVVVVVERMPEKIILSSFLNNIKQFGAISKYVREIYP